MSVPTVSFDALGLLRLAERGSGDEPLGERVPKLFLFLMPFPFDEMSSPELLDEVLSDFEPFGNLSCCKIGILFGYCSLMRPLLLSII